MKYFKLNGKRPTVQEMALMMIIEEDGMKPVTVRLYNPKTNKLVKHTHYKIKPNK